MLHLTEPLVPFFSLFSKGSQARCPGRPPPICGQPRRHLRRRSCCKRLEVHIKTMLLTRLLVWATRNPREPPPPPSATTPCKLTPRHVGFACCRAPAPPCFLQLTPKRSNLVAQEAKMCTVDTEIKVKLIPRKYLFAFAFVFIFLL